MYMQFQIADSDQYDLNINVIMYHIAKFLDKNIRITLLTNSMNVIFWRIRVIKIDYKFDIFNI